MQHNLLGFLACPDCGCESLELADEGTFGNEIVSGRLTCSRCLSQFSIISGIPSLLPKPSRKVEKDLSRLTLASPASSIQQSEMVFRDRHAAVYDNLAAAQAQLEIDFVLAELNLSTQDKGIILDFGCGTGRALLSLIPYSETLIGIDFSLESLKLLQSKLATMGNPANIHLIQGDAIHPPLRSQKFDCIVCVQLLQSFPNTNTRLNVFNQIHRLARPNARLVLSVFYYSLLKQMRAKVIKDPSQDVYEREGLHLGTLYYHNYTIQEIKQLLSQSGFRVQKIRGVNTPLTRRYGSIGAKLEKCIKWSGVLTPFSHWITVSAVSRIVDPKFASQPQGR